MKLKMLAIAGNKDGLRRWSARLATLPVIRINRTETVPSPQLTVPIFVRRSLKLAWGFTKLAAMTMALAPLSSVASLNPVVSESGFISLSQDAMGTNATSGNIRVLKPTGATVRKAYFMSATIPGGAAIPNGAMTLAGVGVNWASSYTNPLPSSPSLTYFADVTAIVKPIIDAAAPGLNTLAIVEGPNTAQIDGEVLAVIFDDPNQTTQNTIAFLFGGQAIIGDTFNISFANPINTADTNLVLDMSLGISFGFQQNGSQQFSLVNINGQRLTTSAGGEDDGVPANGGLITVGGIGDSNANPANPNATPTNARSDDELYNLKPFVTNGATSIGVFTQNPSQNDNIFFASFFLGAATAIVGEGVLLTPTIATNEVGTTHTVTATVRNDAGAPVTNRQVNFAIVAGPHVGTSASGTTDTAGQTTFSYSGTAQGTDQIQASFIDSQGRTNFSNVALKHWIQPVNRPPVAVCSNAVVAADSNCVANASVDGGSSDPDGDPLTIVQSPPGPYPLGTTSVLLTVSDGRATNTCTATVTVIDMTPPVINCPSNIVQANDPGQCSAVVNFTVTATDNCTVPDPGVLYGSSRGGQLFRLNLTTGAGTLVGPLAFDSTEIEYDNATGTAFSQYPDGTFTGQFFDINTGAPTGPPTANGASFTGLEWVGTNLFGATISGTSGPSSLRILDPATGASVIVGATGIGPISGLAYDTATGTMYGITGGPSNASLVTVNLSTGAATIIGNSGFRAGSLEFGPDGNLYGGSTGTNGGNLYRINPATGAATLVGASGFTEITGLTLVDSTNSGSGVTIVCTPPSGSVFPKGTNTVTCTATDAAGNSNSCTFTITVNDTEPPLVACREGANPSGKKIPVAGKNPRSGQNPDGFYQLLARDNCDPNPTIYVLDSISGFLAGPFANGEVVKITQVPGGTPGQQPMAGVVVAHIFVNGDAVLYAVDADGNVGNGVSCLVPPPPK